MFAIFSKHILVNNLLNIPKLSRCDERNNLKFVPFFILNLYI